MFRCESVEGDRTGGDECGVDGEHGGAGDHDDRFEFWSGAFPCGRPSVPGAAAGLVDRWDVVGVLAGGAEARFGGEGDDAEVFDLGGGGESRFGGEVGGTFDRCDAGDLAGRFERGGAGEGGSGEAGAFADRVERGSAGERGLSEVLDLAGGLDRGRGGEGGIGLLLTGDLAGRG